MGRPKIEWADKDWSVFEGLCRIQCTAEEIVDVTHVCEETLNRLIKEKYGETFSECRKRIGAGGKASLRRSQFRLAETNATMAIWLGKQYLGQKDPEQYAAPERVVQIIDDI